MLNRRIVDAAIAIAASMGTLLPPSLVHGADLSSPLSIPKVAVRPEILDVQLNNRGTLVGQVATSGHLPLAKTLVSIQFGAKGVASTKTDADGRFEIKGLRGGVSRVSTVNGQQVVRLWAYGTAPPVARDSLDIIVTPESVVRGQNSCFWTGERITAMLIGIGAAAAVIAIGDDNGSAS